MTRALVALLLTVILAACAEILPVAPAPAVDEASDELLLLVVRSPADRYTVNQPIEVLAELMYQGPNGRETLFHAMSPVWWTVIQQDGPAEMDGGMGMPCNWTELAAGRVHRYPFVRSGIIDDAPPFDRRWFEAPDLRLPVGLWRFVGTLRVTRGGCGLDAVASHDLEAEIDVQVVP